MPDPYRQPTEYLLAFLQRIAMLDKEGFFQRPVREEEAPNYYTVIKSPMCFADMREKINSGAYQTWRQLRDDFNLIHENARRFNSSKTLVHRAAINLQKNGSKVLATYELEVRKALAVLHPHGGQQGSDALTSPTAAAAAAAAADQSGDLGLMPGGSAPPSPHAMLGGLDMAPFKGGDQLGSLQLLGPGSAAPQQSGLLPQSSLLLPPPPRDLLVGYISDDEEPQAVLVAGTDAAAVAVAGAAGRALPGLGPCHALPLDAVLSQLRTTAVRVPYQHLQQRAPTEAGQPEASTAGAGAEGGEGRGGRLHSREWKQARRPVELQARWLELRMLELRGQQERLRMHIVWLQQQQQAGGVVDGGAEGVAGPGPLVAAAAARAAAPCSGELGVLLAAKRGFLSHGRVALSPYVRMRHAAATAAATGASADGGGGGAPDGHTGVSPVAADGSAAAAGPSGASLEAAVAASPPAMPLPQPGQAGLQQQGPGRPAVSLPPGPPQPLLNPVSPEQQQPFDEAEADKMLPGAIFASLELLEQRLGTVRSQLQDTYKFNSARLASSRTPGPYGAAAAGGGGPAGLPMSSSLQLPPSVSQGGGGGNVKRQSSGHARRSGSLTVLTRFDSISMGPPTGLGGKTSEGGNKRKRSEAEMLAGDFGMGTPMGSYSRTSLDRSVVSVGWNGLRAGIRGSRWVRGSKGLGESGRGFDNRSGPAPVGFVSMPCGEEEGMYKEVV